MTPSAVWPTFPGMNDPAAIPERRYALHDSLGYQATLAARVFERRLEDGLREAGLTRIGWCILLAVEEEGLTAPSDIAAFIGIGRTVASRALRQMEAEGLITRHNGTRDRRTTEVRATAEGMRRLTAALPAGLENNAHFNAKLTAAEREALLRLLSKLRAGEDQPLSSF